MPNGPVYFTTYQVAQMMGVTLPTVVNWTKAGKLNAHRTPGGHRRISREDLVQFANTYAVPLPPELQLDSGPPRVLVVDQEQDFSEMLEEYLALKGGVEVRSADGPFSVGLALGRFNPTVMLVDLGMSNLDPIRLARLVSSDSELRQLRLVGVLPFPDPDLVARATAVGYQEVLHKPISLDAVWGALQPLLAR